MPTSILLVLLNQLNIKLGILEYNTKCLGRPWPISPLKSTPVLSEHIDECLKKYLNI